MQFVVLIHQKNTLSGTGEKGKCLVCVQNQGSLICFYVHDMKKIDYGASSLVADLFDRDPRIQHSIQIGIFLRRSIRMTQF